MKKGLLTIAAMLMTASMSMAQFTVTGTSISFIGNTPPTGANTFYSYQPDNGGGVVYTDNTCTTPLATPGGFAPNVFDATTNPCNCYAGGVIFYGGKIRSVFYGAQCTSNSPSFGFSVGSAVNLSNVANQKITFSYQSNAPLALELQLFNTANFVGKLNSLPVNFLGDGLVHTQTIDFSGSVANGAVMTDVNQISFIYLSNTASADFATALSNIKVGSVVTGLTNSTSVANANLFPNPSTGMTTVTGELKSVADVKVVLVDVLGQEVQVIMEERTSSINATFDVSSLKKGIYSVVTNIDGAPSKSQMLVVR
jgi:Secretion system C-terminal sorting domain